MLNYTPYTDIYQYPQPGVVNQNPIPGIPQIPVKMVGPNEDQDRTSASGQPQLTSSQQFYSTFTNDRNRGIIAMSPEDAEARLFRMGLRPERNYSTLNQTPLQHFELMQYPNPPSGLSQNVLNTLAYIGTGNQATPVSSNPLIDLIANHPAIKAATDYISRLFGGR